MGKKLFIVNMLFLFLGNHQLFNKTEHGKLIRVYDAWTYALGTEKRDLDALLGMPPDRQKEISFWSEAQVTIEAANICECLELLLLYIQSNHVGQDCKVFINEWRIKNLFSKKIKDINFSNWPIKIKDVTVFPYCNFLNEEFKNHKGLLVCCDQLIPEQLSRADLCPFSSSESALLGDDECLVSAYFSGYPTLIAEQEIKIHDQEFKLKNVICSH